MLEQPSSSKAAQEGVPAEAADAKEVGEKAAEEASEEAEEDARKSVPAKANRQTSRPGKSSAAADAGRVEQDKSLKSTTQQVVPAKHLLKSPRQYTCIC